jgi:hypothetical protein
MRSPRSMVKFFATLGIAAGSVGARQILEDPTSAFTAFCAGVYVLAQAYKLIVEAHRGRRKK